jgi:hypothetical protein
VGRQIIAAIGIDRYRHWRPLGNAVGDAVGATALFRRLGFEEVAPPLLDERATRDAIDALVTDELTSLHENDSLIVFYAGHGGTRTQRVGGHDVRTGYLIPVDAAGESGRVKSWIELDPWLRRISKLPPRHILVILDACFSGIALSRVVKWGRGSGSLIDLPFAAANARHSRLVITSAADDEQAMDNGPVAGHSLFTGCLIEALTGGVSPVGQRGDRHVTIGSRLGNYVRDRVQTYPGRPGWRQTPDLGTFDYDDRGEMLIPVLIEADAAAASAARRSGERDAFASLTSELYPIEAAAIDSMAIEAAAIEAVAIAALTSTPAGSGPAPAALKFAVSPDAAPAPIATLASAAAGSGSAMATPKAAALSARASPACGPRAGAPASTPAVSAPATVESASSARTSVAPADAAPAQSERKSVAVAVAAPPPSALKSVLPVASATPIESTRKLDEPKPGAARVGAAPADAPNGSGRSGEAAVASSAAQVPGGDSEPTAGPLPARRQWRSRWRWFAVTLGGLLGGVVVAIAIGDGQRGDGDAPPSSTDAAGSSSRNAGSAGPPRVGSAVAANTTSAANRPELSPSRAVTLGDPERLTDNAVATTEARDGGAGPAAAASKPQPAGRKTTADMLPPSRGEATPTAPRPSIPAASHAAPVDDGSAQSPAPTRAQVIARTAQVPGATCPTWIKAPRGARALLGDVTVTVPGEMRLLCGVEVKVQFERDHYLPTTKTFTPTVGGPDISVTLKKVPADVEVRSDPEGAMIIVNDKSLGTTPTVISLPKFETTSITLDKDGYVPAPRKFKPVDGGTSLNVKLTPVAPKPP